MRSVDVQLCLAAIAAAANNILLMRTRNHAFLLLVITLAWKMADSFTSQRYLFINKQTWRSNDKTIIRRFILLIGRCLLEHIGNIQNVKLKFYFFPEKRLYFLMFITAVCFLFLLKLKWPKPTKIYDFKINVLFPSDVS